MTKQGKLTRNAKAFMSANDVSLMEEQSIDMATKASTYVLRNGKRFVLSMGENRAVAERGYPKWFPEE